MSSMVATVHKGPLGPALLINGVQVMSWIDVFNEAKAESIADHINRAVVLSRSTSKINDGASYVTQLRPQRRFSGENPGENRATRRIARAALSLGKGEVLSSILSGSTRKPNKIRRFFDRSIRGYRTETANGGGTCTHGRGFRRGKCSLSVHARRLP